MLLALCFSTLLNFCSEQYYLADQILPSINVTYIEPMTISIESIYNMTVSIYDKIDEQTKLTNELFIMFQTELESIGKDTEKLETIINQTVITLMDKDIFDNNMYIMFQNELESIGSELESIGSKMQAMDYSFQSKFEYLNSEIVSIMRELRWMGILIIISYIFIIFLSVFGICICSYLIIKDIRNNKKNNLF